jgi:Ca2+-binding EF-hand superfamily protein
MDVLSGLSIVSMYQSKGIEYAANKLFDHKDENGNGLLNAIEFGGPPDQFDRMDANGDEQVDKEEIMAFLPKSLFNHRAAMMIHEKDTNESRTLSFDEMNISKNVFNEIDQNQDGEVDTKELGQFLSERSGQKGPSHSDHAQGGKGSQDSTDDETDTEEETVIRIDTDQDGQVDTEQVTTYIPQLNIYQTTTTYLANAGFENDNNQVYV